VYHLFYADEEGHAGSDMTFFEYPNARRGTAGAGMIHQVTWRVASEEALDFWEKRLSEAGFPTERRPGSLRFDDPEGLGLELTVAETADAPLIADHPEIPKELALQGFDSVRAYAYSPDQSRRLFENALGFKPLDDSSWESRGDARGSTYHFDEPPSERGVPGAGTVHHVAWASQTEDHEAWRERVAEAGAHPTPVIDRFYFKSVYFREPSGVLFEIATIGPGFATDEPLEHLGERLSLPPSYEHLRAQLEPILTPLPDPRAVRGEMTELIARRREADGEPEGVLVLIHGRGADENDLYPVLDYLDPERRFLGVTPRGPLSLPPGGAHWYAVREIGYPDRDTFLHSYGELSDFVDSLGFPAERTVIGGFSQGAVMTYALGLG
jgi:glyoxalase family protein